MDELRKGERFSDYGRLECSEICAFPGILRDISESGLKASFDAPVSICMDDEYEITLKLPRESLTLRLLTVPVWRFEETGRTQIGFSVLKSLDFAHFENYVKNFECSANDFDILGIGNKEWAESTVQKVIEELRGFSWNESRSSCQMI